MNIEVRLILSRVGLLQFVNDKNKYMYKFFFRKRKNQQTFEELSKNQHPLLNVVISPNTGNQSTIVQLKAVQSFFFFSCTVLLHTSVNSVAFNCTTVAPLSSNHDYDCFQRYVLLNWMFFSIYLMTIQLQMRGFVSLPATELMITLKLTFTYTCLVLKCLTSWYFEDTQYR